MKLVIEIPATEILDSQDLTIVYEQLVPLVLAVNRAANKVMLQFPRATVKMVGAQ